MRRNSTRMCRSVGGWRQKWRRGKPLKTNLSHYSFDYSVILILPLVIVAVTAASNGINLHCLSATTTTTSKAHIIHHSNGRTNEHTHTHHTHTRALRQTRANKITAYTTLKDFIDTMDIRIYGAKPIYVAHMRSIVHALFGVCCLLTFFHITIVRKHFASVDKHSRFISICRTNRIIIVWTLSFAFFVRGCSGT